MNIAALVLIVVVAWSVLSVLVAFTVGGMAKARDLTMVDDRVATPAIASYDEGLRTAV